MKNKWLKLTLLGIITAWFLVTLIFYEKRLVKIYSIFIESVDLNLKVPLYAEEPLPKNGGGKYKHITLECNGTTTFLQLHSAINKVNESCSFQKLSLSFDGAIIAFIAFLPDRPAVEVDEIGLPVNRLEADQSLPIYGTDSDSVKDSIHSINRYTKKFDETPYILLFVKETGSLKDIESVTK